ncbi:MAG: Uma2 family endonuclease [Myxococcota bacterium]
MKPARKPATYDDVLAAPEHLVAEIIAGELYTSPRPAGPHSEAGSVLGMLVGTPFRLGKGGPGGWWILYEPELHLGEHVLVPDLAGWRREHHPDLDRAAAHFSTAPDWVCEVLSPSTRSLDRVRKMPLYAEYGVGHLWLVDPESQTVEVFRLENQRWSLLGTYAGDTEIRAEPFDAVPIPIGELWIA